MAARSSVVAQRAAAPGTPGCPGPGPELRGKGPHFFLEGRRNIIRARERPGIAPGLSGAA